MDTISYSVMPTMNTTTKRLKSEWGASMVEYALAVAMIGFVAAIGLQMAGCGLSRMLTRLGGELESATIPGIP